MAAESTQALVEAIRELDDDAKAAIGKELAPHIPVTLGRRGMLQTGVAALLGAGAVSGGAAAAREGVQPAAAANGVLSDINVLESGDGTVMTAGNAIQQANEAVSSATTIGNVCYIEVDTSIAGFTVTIPASLETSGMELRFADAGGSAGTNNYTIDSANWTIDGSPTLTVDASDGVTKLYSMGDRWVTRRFIQRLDAGTIATETLVSDRHYAGAFSGADADARLDNALNKVGNGEVIYLENATYSDNRTIGSEIIIIGTNSTFDINGTEITGTWTLNESVTLKFMAIRADPDFTVAGVTLSECRIRAALTTDQNTTRVLNCDGGAQSFTFGAGTISGIADGNTRLSVTDDGTNTVGDNS